MTVLDKVLRETEWQRALLDELMGLLRARSVSKEFEEAINKGCGIHLAILVEPYLSYILEGKKTIESRFSQNRQPPFERVFAGDVLLLKRSSGPIAGLCMVSDSWFYRLKPETWTEIERFRQALCMDESQFWQDKRKALYGTLMRLSSIERLSPLQTSKVDPRGWVTLRDKEELKQGDLF